LPPASGIEFVIVRSAETPKNATAAAVPTRIFDWFAPFATFAGKVKVAIDPPEASNTRME
jgi:hypothetical protein